MDGFRVNSMTVSACKLGNGPLALALASVLASGILKELTKLCLIGSGIGDQRIRSLCKALTSDALSSTFEELNVMGNQIGDKGLLTLAS